MALKNDSIQSIIDIVSCFSHEKSKLDSIGANVMFSLRYDTYDILTQIVESPVYAPLKIMKHNSNAFTLESPEWPLVVEKRLDMHNEICIACGIVKGKADSIDDVINPIRSELRLDIESDRSLLNQLVRINNYGLRCVMDFFAQSSWHDYLLERFIGSYRVGLLCYMLDGRRRYSEKRTRFPNIYLVNSKYITHPPTYWLKRLLIGYITMQHNNELEVDVLKVKKFFTTGAEGVYPEDIVEECLSDLCQVHYANLLSADLKFGPTKTKISPKSLSLTERGSYMINDLHDKFIYLQLVVEDNDMPLPSFLLNKLSYKRMGDLEYGYLVLPKDSYITAAYKMIMLKAEYVMIFLELLEAAKEYEEKKYHLVWRRLYDAGVIIDVAQWKGKIVTELNNLASTKHIPMNMEKILSDIIPPVRRQLKEYFSKLH